MSKEKVFQYSELYFLPSKEFGGIKKRVEDAKFVIFGVPYDATTTFRPGTRFAPSSIREASINIETVSILTKDYLEYVNFYDAGDLDVIGLDVKECLRRITTTIEDIVRSGRFPIMIGGEHTITYAAIKALRPDQIIIFDAHFDLRDEYPTGTKLSHATVSRRIYEDIGVKNIVYLGVRAWSKEEYDFLKNTDIHVYDILSLKYSFNEALNTIKNLTRNHEKVYISIDMDALDPSHAPGVSNPEPNGIYTHEIYPILKELINEKLIGMDIVEVCPSFDNGNTSILAAKILIECLTLWNKSFIDKVRSRLIKNP
jgi:agmatinase